MANKRTDYYDELVARYGEPTPENRARLAASAERAAEAFMSLPDDGLPSGDPVLDALYEAAVKIRDYRDGCAAARVRRPMPAYA